MVNITVSAKVLHDGTLSIPRTARKTLDLHEGDQVEIMVSKQESAEKSTEVNPLLAIIGIGKGGPIDGAEDHDSSLYRRHSA